MGIHGTICITLCLFGRCRWSLPWRPMVSPHAIAVVAVIAAEGGSTTWCIDHTHSMSLCFAVHAPAFLLLSLFLLLLLLLFVAVPIASSETFSGGGEHGSYPWAKDFLQLDYNLPSYDQVMADYPHLTNYTVGNTTLKVIPVRLLEEYHR